MSAIVIACLGSPFGADGLGHAVADILHTDPALQSLPDGLLHIESSDRPQLSLLGQIEGAELAIIVDAVQGGNTAGQIMLIQAEQLAENDQNMSSHSIGVAETLMLGRTLGLLPPRLLIMGLCIGQTPNWEPDREDLIKLADSIVDELMHFVNTRDFAKASKFVAQNKAGY